MRKLKPISIVMICNLAAILLLFLSLYERSMNETLLSVGLGTLGFALLELVVGIFVSIAGTSGSKQRQYGQALMLASALLFIASFTMCTGGFGAF